MEKPVLRTPGLTKDFILQTYASGRGIGAVEIQNFEDGERPVAFFTKKGTTGANTVHGNREGGIGGC